MHASELGGDSPGYLVGQPLSVRAHGEFGSAPLCWEGRYLHYRRGHDEKGEAQRGYVQHNY